MCGQQQTGSMLKMFREQNRLSQRAVAIKTQLVDENGCGISESVLSQIENGKRPLTGKYLQVIAAASIFSPSQFARLRDQAITDHIRRHFGDDAPLDSVDCSK